MALGRVQHALNVELVDLGEGAVARVLGMGFWRRDLRSHPLLQHVLVEVSFISQTILVLHVLTLILIVIAIDT